MNDVKREGDEKRMRRKEMERKGEAKHGGVEEERRKWERKNVNLLIIGLKMN
jgi:hypothetical protein